MNTTVPSSSITGISEASMMIVTEPSALAKIGVSHRTNSPFAARAIMSLMP